MPRPLRELLNDFRLAAWYIGFTAACVWAAVAGTYWGWWAFVWDLALPIRVAGVVWIASSAFILWYGVVFTSHYYFGFPKQNPLSPSAGSVGGPGQLSLGLNPVFDESNLLLLAVTNHGATDKFAAQISYLIGTRNWLVLPFSIRWLDETTGTHELLKGHGHQLQVLRLTLNEQKNRVDEIEFFSPGGSQKITPAPEGLVEGAMLYQPVHISINITSASNGSQTRFYLVLEMAIFGARLTVRPYILRD